MSMLRSGVMLTVICVLLCLSFNYTFPLSRESSKWNIFVNNNRESESLHCDKKGDKHSLQHLKNLPAIENTLKIIDNSTNKFRKAQCRNVDSSDDLSNFEEMVIMKKNPYVDFKELEYKYYNEKNSRPSVETGPNLVEDPALCELENSINVEIINRGLSGFAVPSKLLKNSGLLSKYNVGNNAEEEHKNAMEPVLANDNPTHRNPTQELLSALRDDIKQFKNLKL